MESVDLVSPSVPRPGGAGCSAAPVRTRRLGMLKAALGGLNLPGSVLAGKLLEARLRQLF